VSTHFSIPEAIPFLAGASLLDLSKPVQDNETSPFCFEKKIFSILGVLIHNKYRFTMGLTVL
jgi:hypothetical protein